jgi:3-hydroxybutyryl-CoA dehydrogenase
MNHEIKSVGVAGAGTMGQGIAVSCALAGYNTLLFDIQSDFCQKGLEMARKSIDQLVAKGKVSGDESELAKARLSSTNEIVYLKADLIIEAIVEKMEVKQSLFSELEKHNRQDTILATNTSSLSVNQIAQILTNKSRFAGLHFFNPAHLMKLVEVISGEHTSPDRIEELKHFVASLSKVAVVAKDSPGFIVNRVARPYYAESLKLLEDESADEVSIDRLLRGSGFKMGPFELMDLIGIDVNYAVTTSVYEGLKRPSKFKPSETQRRKIEEGNLGRKTGKGFYDYSKK